MPEIKQPKEDAPWHILSVEAALSQVQATTSGLDTVTAAERLARYGANRLRPVRPRSTLMRFLAQFHNLLIYVLIAAGIVTSLLNHWIDSGVIFGVVIINALIGFIQEGKAERALDAIRNMLSHKAMVKRDGRFISLLAEELVPGDIVLLQSGDKVPADIRLYDTHELRIDEAMLTGESVPVDKDIQAVDQVSAIGDRSCMAYSGTLVSYGQGHGVVVETGDRTEIGHISGLLREVQVLATPLLRQMATFASWLTVAILAIAALTFIFGILVHGYTATEMFLAAVGLAVAAIPEGLPAIMTITLAIGVQKMAHNHAIIRRLPAVETLGSVTVICSDKTGTLTKNEMTVTTVCTSEGQLQVSGSGYDPHGGFTRNGKDVDHDTMSHIRNIAHAALLCNDANIVKKHGRWQVHGDPTEGALISFALKTGLEQVHTQEEYPRTDVIPFESQHRYMATMHHDHAGHGIIYIKGAPERILEMCNRQCHLGDDRPLDVAFWEEQMHDMGSRGERLLAIAFRDTHSEHRNLYFEDIKGSLTLMGIVGIIDPPRYGAIRAVKDCQTAGIRVKMITGDHTITASAIGRQMGIGVGSKAITGSELDQLKAEQWPEVVKSNDVFARVSPEQKLQIVTALQANGEVVSMTGDGVNDAPALKRADVGVAMGIKGTEVAKEAAEMILADDNFASIARAVAQGRTVYDNLKKSILFILPTNVGEALTIIAAIMFGRLLPITAVQILWVNMITAVTLALTLAFEKAEQNVMERPPRDPGEPLLSGFLLWRIAFVSLILVSGTFGLFIWEREQGASIELARTVAVNTLVMFEIFYLFNARYLYAPSLTREGLLGNRYALYAIGILVLMQLAFTYATPMQALFGTTAIDLVAWVRIVVIASTVFILVELEKMILRRFSNP
jgi:magnesium-transporting ATPase (P-type)